MDEIKARLDDMIEEMPDLMNSNEIYTFEGRDQSECRSPLKPTARRVYSLFDLGQKFGEISCTRDTLLQQITALQQKQGTLSDKEKVDLEALINLYGEFDKLYDKYYRSSQECCEACAEWSNK